MKSVSSEQMRQLDAAAIANYSIPSLLLMENAGSSVSQVIRREYDCCRVVVVVGKGNNGGDGLVVARHLQNSGYPVQVVLLEDPENLKTDPRVNYTICRQMKIPIVNLSQAVKDDELFPGFRDAELIVDAIFGVGLHSPVRGVFELAIQLVNGCQKPVVSIDIPSGLDADTGIVHGEAVRATWTITLALPKHGLYKREGPSHAGKIEVADIGIPRELIAPFLR